MDILQLPKNYNHQLFVATHSEHIIKEALCDEEILLIALSRNANGDIQAKAIDDSNCILPFVSHDEIRYRVFGLLSNDYHDDLLGFIQEQSGENCKRQDAIFQSGPNCPLKHWDGYDKNGIANTSLDTKSLPFYIRNYYHHPELRKFNNSSVSPQEIKASTEYLERYVTGILGKPYPTI